jgi:hypothetical protein
LRQPRQIASEEDVRRIVTQGSLPMNCRPTTKACRVRAADPGRRNSRTITAAVPQQFESRVRRR